MDGRRDRFLQVRNGLLDPVDEIDRVGAGLPLDRQALGRRVEIPCADAFVLRRVDDIGDVLEAHRRAVPVRHDDFSKGGRVEQLIVGVEGVDLVRAFEGSLRPIDGRRRQRSAHLFEADAPRRKRAGIDLDTHRIRSRAEDPRFRDAVHRRQLLRQVRVGVVVDLVDRHRIGMDRVDQHRAIGRIGLSVGRGVWQVLGQEAAGGVDRGLHILRCGIDVSLEIELQSDRQRPDAARRGHLVERRDRGELLLERCRDRRGHRVRAGAGIVDRYDDRWKVDPRQGRHRQEAIGADAEDEHPQHQQRGRDWAADKRL